MRCGFHRPIRIHLSAIGARRCRAACRRRTPPPARRSGAPRGRPRAQATPASSTQRAVRGRGRGTPAAAARRRGQYRDLPVAAGRTVRDAAGRRRRAGRANAATLAPAPRAPPPGGAPSGAGRCPSSTQTAAAGALAERRVEPGHQQRVGAELVEEMALDGDPLDTEHVCQQPASVRSRRSPGPRSRPRAAAGAGRCGAGRRLRSALPLGMHRDRRRAAPGRPGPCSAGSLPRRYS